MTTIERIHKLLEQEQKVIERTKEEVTVDFNSVRSGFRVEALEEVIEIFRQDAENGVG